MASICSSISIIFGASATFFLDITVDPFISWIRCLLSRFMHFGVRSVKIANGKAGSYVASKTGIVRSCFL